MKKRVTFRLADQFDLRFLQDQIEKQNVEKIDLTKCVTVVAEYDGKVIGSTSAQLAWLIEPQMVFNVEGVPTNALRRAMLGSYREIDKIIQQSGTTKQFCHIPKDFPNVGWAIRQGFRYIWEEAWTWLSKE